MSYVVAFLRRILLMVCGISLGLCQVSADDPLPVLRDPQLQVRLLTTVPGPRINQPCRIAKDPRNNQLYYLTLLGTIYRLDVQPGNNPSGSVELATSSDHGLTNANGFAVGPDGSFYVVGNETSPENSALTLARVMRGEINPNGRGRRWSTVAYTDPYARSKTTFDHGFNAVEISPDGKTLYLNTGSRTDHGEIQSAEGQFPGLREDSLTAAIFRVPANATQLRLPRDLEQLRAQGRIFCEGTRNSYDLRFSPKGELFGTENGPDRDMSDELNWLREGRHYGFPWRMGGTENPQQFPDYDPAKDKLLTPSFYAVKSGYFKNDPTFPHPPGSFTEPVRNLGPDADQYRDAADGVVKDASDQGVPFATFTSHRSPLGLVFDETRGMAAPYQGNAFVLSWNYGDETGDTENVAFHDASQDLLHVELNPKDDNYEAHVTKLVTGFRNPIDAEVIGRRVFVICYGGERSIWEITFPPAPGPVLSEPAWTPTGFAFSLTSSQAGSQAFQISSNLIDWSTLWSPTFPLGTSFFLDGSADRLPGMRFYRTQRIEP